MLPGVGHGVAEGFEEVPFVREMAEGPDGFEKLTVARPEPIEEHGDAARLEFGDDLAQRVGTGRIEDLDLRERTLADGSNATVKLDANFTVTGTESGHR